MKYLTFNLTPKLNPNVDDFYNAIFNFNFVKKFSIFYLIKFFFIMLVAVVLKNPSCLYACSVCFGKGSEDLQKGFYWGILLLLLLPVALIGTIGTAIIYTSRKKSNMLNNLNKVGVQ